MTLEDGGANDTDHLLLWDEYWKKASIVVMESNNNWNMTNTTVSSSSDTDTDNYCQILDSRHALEVFQSLDLLVGFHP